MYSLKLDKISYCSKVSPGGYWKIPPYTLFIFNLKVCACTVLLITTLPINHPPPNQGWSTFEAIWLEDCTLGNTGLNNILMLVTKLHQHWHHLGTR